MTKRITMAVLAEKIDYLREDIGEIKTDVRSNTEFRMQAKGFVSAIVLVSSAITGIMVKLFSYLFSRGGQ